MGQLISKKKKKNVVLKERKILMLGLDNSGKSTIIYTLKFGMEVRTRPTIGFNVESIIYDSSEFTVIDVGGSPQIRSLWKHYFDDIDAVIYVIDGSDETRFKEARNTFDSLLLEPQLKKAALLILSNKSDIPKSKSSSDIEHMLLLPNSGRLYKVLETSAILGEGLVEAFCWLEQILNQRDRDNDVEPTSENKQPSVRKT